ncbi:hypothetical protein AB0I72_19840 [Nocardiopsis sp. NPDC049922]|uniref:hypothetical protein n=1 Tax=Nocardiopsis sp. NPDC049922 TaxID=3155157 RepID=UPI0033CF4AB9
MSRADEVLDLIDSALDDWSVSGDAMRSIPTDSDAPGTPVLTPERVADAYDVPCRLVMAPHDLARLQWLFEHYRTHVTQAWASMRPAFEQLREITATVARPTRGNHWTLWPHPRQDPDPKAWVAFTDQPGRQKRPRRRGPDPRRVNVRRAPARTGRRP